MTYDMEGGFWTKNKWVTHNTPLDKMKERLKAWNIFPPDKLCIGLVNYGYGYNGLNFRNNIP